MNKWIKSGDHVQVIAGNDKGKIAKVIARDKEKILISGVNVRKKHMKPQGNNKQGQIVEMEKPIHISNVRLCVKDEPTAKIKLKVSSKGDKELVYKANDKTKVYRNIRKQDKKAKKEAAS